MKLLLCVTALFFLNNSATFSQSYNWGWAKSAGGINTDDAYSVCTDFSGNVYITGLFQSPVINFGGISLINYGGASGTADLFVVKYDPSGYVLWAKSAGGDNNDYGRSIATDIFGNVYITGNFSSDSMLVANTTLINHTGGLHNMFVIKYDSLGNDVWAFASESNSLSEGLGIAMDEKGNGYFTGFFLGSLNLGSGTLNNLGIYNIFIAKFDSSGSIIWAQSAGTNGGDFPSSICLDKDANVYITGAFSSDSIVFGTNTLFNTGNYDIFTVKLDSSGNEKWAVSAGGYGEEQGKGVIADENENVYITGGFDSPFITFDSTTFFNNGGFDLFIVKYDSTGILQWAKHAGHNGYYDWGYSLQANHTGLYACGLFSSDSIIFDNIILTNSGTIGTTDLFLVKYDFAGNLMWANSASGNESEEGTSIALDTMDNCFVAGGFAGSYVLFGTTYLPNLSLTGNADVFLAKFQAYSVGIDQTTVTDLKIFPNPVNDYLWINSDMLSLAKKVEISLYNSLGIKVHTSMLFPVSNATKVECGNLLPGFYTLIISSENTVFRTKFIKE